MSVGAWRRSRIFIKENLACDKVGRIVCVCVYICVCVCVCVCAHLQSISEYAKGSGSPHYYQICSGRISFGAMTALHLT